MTSASHLKFVSDYYNRELDVGCGTHKVEGAIGLDSIALPGASTWFTQFNLA